MFRPPGQCPACGEWVPRGAVACDDCGACDRSGWKSERAVYDGLDLPDEDFDYNEFVEREFGQEKTGPRVSREIFWRWVAAIVLAVMILGYIMSAF
ncbi:hypothetical protein EI77_02826 [Prosthecobacter fusiformis]|uniref:Zinc ribbon protein n=1 Tax=Prosthecobacter fusiformis TaxID=48464 RepID=A0A4R7S080_9BACT|nr:zinc ribbon domain-containing protein [Prosthecobacter fusiformis]TDU70778.1 hypothetical protein EI77_02826 [Prosthecobacter fusiformis]